MQRAHRIASDLARRQQSHVASLNAFIALPTEKQLRQTYDDAPSGQLQDTRVAVKDNICTADLPTTCASKGLDGYTSPFDATVVAQIRAAGGLVVGKTNLDEFGMGSHSQHSAFGQVRTDHGYSAGGSSGGSAVAVATGQCDVALGTDTGGSVRLPAAFNGIFGFKPSYGLVSRMGVVAYANSLDTVGFLTKDVGHLKALFETTNAYDALDPTSLKSTTRIRIQDVVKSHQKEERLRIGVARESITEELSPDVRQSWTDTLHELQGAGHSVELVSLPSLPHALSAYYILAPAEASSNLAKYDGVRYGKQAPVSPELGPLYAKTRQHGLGQEVRRRILLGAYSLSASAIDNYFMQAQRIRRMLVQDFDAAFSMPNVLSTSGKDLAQAESATDGVDVLLMPTAPTLPPRLDEVKAQSPLDAYAIDALTVPASLAGLPALSVPVGAHVGLQVIGQFGDDERVLRVGEMIAGLGVR